MPPAGTPPNTAVQQAPPISSNGSKLLSFLIWSGVGGVAPPIIVWLLSYTSPTLWSAAFAIHGGLSQMASNILAQFGGPVVSLLGDPIPFTPSFFVLITMGLVLEAILAFLPGACFGGGLYLCLLSIKAARRQISHSLLYLLSALVLFAIVYISITVYWSEIKKTSGNDSLFDTKSYYFLNQVDVIAQAKARRDPSLCDNLTSPLYIAQCYQQSDPQYQSSEKTCALYMAQGDREQADYIQRDCLINKIYKQARSMSPADILDCDSIAAQSSGNRQADFIVKECHQIALLQKAVEENNPAICDAILQSEPSHEYDFVAMKHAACIVHFFGSAVWRKGCDAYKDNDYFGVDYSDLASCKRTTVSPPENPEPYWFSTTTSSEQ